MKTTSQIEARLDQIPKTFSALRDQALSYLPLDSTIDSDNNVLIGHAPQVGPEAYKGTTQPTTVSPVILDEWVTWMVIAGKEKACDFDGWGTSV